MKWSAANIFGAQKSADQLKQYALAVVLPSHHRSSLSATLYLSSDNMRYTLLSKEKWWKLMDQSSIKRNQIMGTL
jgi:hypothetical protein